MKKQTIELLAPAKNLECGIAAIDHGADAVYIGAPQFGARAAVGNSIDDIHTLCGYAHQFQAKVYVTVNTIVYENELEGVRSLLKQLAEIGVDAILVQDMAVVKMMADELGGATSQLDIEDGRVPALHASTQTDNRTPEKVAWLHSIGFKRVVLARELSLDEIRSIHEQNPDVELEVFVHGALCVSYSGACYASQYCFGRSANRGACAQFCRLKFDLVDATGKTLEHDRHLLSLKDMCQIDELESLMQAGAVSFKIEGRLKDVGYVKNVVAAYSQRINEIIAKHPTLYKRASAGKVNYKTFHPNLKKTFNRGFTHYFLHGRQPDIASFDTPKAMGEYVGFVKEIRGNSFNVAGTATFANGDGLCFINADRELEGFRVNRVEHGNRLFPLKMPEHLRAGMALYRNNDMEFERILSRPTAERKLSLNLRLMATDGGFDLMASDETGRVGRAHVDIEHQEAQKPQEENIRRQLSKLGNTPFELSTLVIDDGARGYFIPSSVLADLRRHAIEDMCNCLGNLEDDNETEDDEAKHDVCNDLVSVSPKGSSFHGKVPAELTLANVANSQAREFYRQCGIEGVPEAYEVASDSRIARFDNGGEAVADLSHIMTCRYCVRYALGYCVKNGGKQPTWKEPLFLTLPDGKRFRLQFDCKHCQMNIYAQNT